MRIETIENGKIFYAKKDTSRNMNSSFGRTAWNAACVKLRCYCGSVYTKRIADIKRGWGKSCSKSCAAKKKTHGNPSATYMDGSKVSWGKSYTKKQATIKPVAAINTNDDWDELNEDPSWEAHKDCF